MVFAYRGKWGLTKGFFPQGRGPGSTADDSEIGGSKIWLPFNGFRPLIDNLGENVI